jgi:hypothetical protein
MMKMKYRKYAVRLVCTHPSKKCPTPGKIIHHCTNKGCPYLKPEVKGVVERYNH